MDAAVTQRHTASFLPKIAPDKNERNKSTINSRMMEPHQAGLVSHKCDQLLSKAEISLFKNSIMQNICVEMLQEGFHRSYSELFFLLSYDRHRRESAELGSDLSLQTPLEEQKDKLTIMRKYLSRAEQAERTNTWTVVCEQRLFLGGYFSSKEDLWISFHFYHSCAEREHGGRSRPATEARACLAELYLQTGDLERAQEQAELCIDQGEEGGWLDSDGRPLRLRGHLALWKVYSRMADSLLEAEDYEEALKMLHTGYNTAIKTEDRQVEVEAAYQLGLAYQSAGDHDTAKQFFNTCMQIYGTLEDGDGLGRTYKAIAKSLESEEKLNETVQCLETLADISRGNGLQHHLVDAYLSLGNICYKRSEYQRALEFFQQGYEISCELRDVSRLERAQVFVATARARCLIRKYSTDVESATPTAMKRLLAWRETREPQDFSVDSSDDTDHTINQ
ncbi:tetratricopeptide repeat protein 29 [Cheilinus undulatus]|uniref:tetratricopeptide repeat protein 29 n=1 Tax=Cheilinus undulatus TaxID=241271 RepID=UPI001BD4107D|nr:tetratricopeptide repeat protein 29 [Cheilinus undulatus]